MNYLDKAYTALVTGLGVVVGFLWGDLGGTMKILLCFIVFDFVTGLLTGIVEKNLSSQTAFRGIARKFLELLIVSAGHLLDVYVLGSGDAIFTATAFLFIGTEGISLLENAGRLGVPIPQKMIDMLSQLKVTSVVSPSTNKDEVDGTEKKDNTDKEG